jgi:hypothetical protein
VVARSPEPRGEQEVVLLPCRESGPPAVPKSEDQEPRAGAEIERNGKGSKGMEREEMPDDDRDDEPERMIEDATTKL